MFDFYEPIAQGAWKCNLSTLYEIFEYQIQSLKSIKKISNTLDEPKFQEKRIAQSYLQYINIK